MQQSRDQIIMAILGWLYGSFENIMAIFMVFYLVSYLIVLISAWASRWLCSVLRLCWPLSSWCCVVTRQLVASWAAPNPWRRWLRPSSCSSGCSMSSSPLLKLTRSSIPAFKYVLHTLPTMTMRLNLLTTLQTVFVEYISVSHKTVAINTNLSNANTFHYYSTTTITA